MYKIIVLVVVWLVTCSVAQCQVESALRLSQSGSFEEAEAQFEQIADPDRATMLARAYNYSWWGKHEEAENLFTGILSAGQDLDAALGQAYNSLYATDLSTAMHRFKILKSQWPLERSIRIGLALTYLEKNQFGLAGYEIRELEKMSPYDAEVYYLAGLMHMKNRHFEKAQLAFDNALEIRPGYPAVVDQLAAIPKRSRPWELTPWAGLSNIYDKTNFGLRRLDAFYRLGENDLLFAYYDNSIRFENQFFSINGIHAPQVGLGYTHRWNRRWGSGLTLADRLVPDESNAFLIRFEQEFYLNDHLRLEGGLQYDKTASQQLGLYSVSLEKRWSPLFSLEINYFYTDQDRGSKDTDRLLLVPKFRFAKGTELDIGYYAFLFDRPEGRQQSFEGIFFTLKQPLSQAMNLRFLFHNQSQGQEDLVSTALGLTVKL